VKFRVSVDRDELGNSLLLMQPNEESGYPDLFHVPYSEMDALLAEVKRVTGFPEEPRPAIWYLGSPYSAPGRATMAARHRQACEAAARLFERGIFTYGPIAHTVAIDQAGRMNAPAFEFWATFDLGMIDRLTGLMVLMIDGWQDSKGLAAELAHARATGKPVLWCEPEIVDGHVVGYALHEDTVPAGVEA